MHIKFFLNLHELLNPFVEIERKRDRVSLVVLVRSALVNPSRITRIDYVKRICNASSAIILLLIAASFSGRREKLLAHFA